MLHTRAIGLLAAASLLLATSAADAATVSVRALPEPSASIDELAFLAAPGERNDVVVRFTQDPYNYNAGNHFWT